MFLLFTVGLTKGLMKEFSIVYLSELHNRDNKVWDFSTVEAF